MRQRLDSVTGVIHVLEMAAGQLWRLVLDSWGIAGLGLVAALFLIVHHGARSDLRIMAALSVGVTTVIACTAPAALPPDQPQAWASGRHLDGMIIVFFLAGAALLLRARFRHILACAAGATALFVLAAVTVAVYAGSSVPTSGFAAAFNFAEPAVLTLNWTQASVLLATAVTLGLLAVWIGFAAVVRHWWQVAVGGLGRFRRAYAWIAHDHEGFSTRSRRKSLVIMGVSRGRRAGRG